MTGHCDIWNVLSVNCTCEFKALCVLCVCVRLHFLRMFFQLLSALVFACHVTIRFPAQIFCVRFVMLLHVFPCLFNSLHVVFPLVENILPRFGCLVKFRFAGLVSAFMPLCFAFRASVFPCLKPVFVHSFCFVCMLSVSAMCRFHLIEFTVSRCIKIMNAPLSKVNNTCFHMPIPKELNARPPQHKECKLITWKQSSRSIQSILTGRTLGFCCLHLLQN